MKTILKESGRVGEGETIIARIKPPDQGTVNYFDRGYAGLALQVSHGGKRTWYHFYRTDRLRRRKLGTYPALTLDEARAEWRRDRNTLEQEGIDPKEKHREQTAASVTFREVVEDYHNRYQVGEAGNDSSDAVRDALLKECASWLDRRLDGISPREIGALVEGIRDDGRKYWSNRVFAYLRTFFDWCARPNVGYVERSPMDAMVRPFKNEKSRDRWYDDSEIAALWNAANHLGIYEGAFLRVMLLTGKRKNALAAMRHDEIGSDGWWRMTDAKGPGTKKLNQPIPLPEPALQIVRNLPQLGDNPYVFAGRKKDAHLDPGSSLQRRVQEKSGIEDFYWHAVRHTVATKLSELRIPGNAARRFTDHATRKDAHEAYTHDTLEYVTHDAADAWGRYVRLVASHHIWDRVSSYLKAEKISDGDERRKIQRGRMREFCNLIQTGGQTWTIWVRGITRSETRDKNVIPMRA